MPCAVIPNRTEYFLNGQQSGRIHLFGYAALAVLGCRRLRDREEEIGDGDELSVVDPGKRRGLVWPGTGGTAHGTQRPSADAAAVEEQDGAERDASGGGSRLYRANPAELVAELPGRRLAPAAAEPTPGGRARAHHTG